MFILIVSVDCCSIVDASVMTLRAHFGAKLQQGTQLNVVAAIHRFYHGYSRYWIIHVIESYPDVIDIEGKANYKAHCEI